MSASSRKLDRLQATFNHDGIVANAGLIVPATLMVRLGLEQLIDTWVRTGSARPGRKILTLVAAMLAGGTHIDHVNMLRAGATQRVLPFKVMAPSTIGTFQRFLTRTSRQQSPTSTRAPGSTSTTPSAVKPRSPKRPTPPADRTSSERSASSCAGPDSPNPLNDVSGPTGDTTPSSPPTTTSR